MVEPFAFAATLAGWLVMASLPEQWDDALARQMHRDQDCTLVLLIDVRMVATEAGAVMTARAICRDERIFAIEGPASDGTFRLVLEHGRA